MNLNIATIEDNIIDFQHLSRLLNNWEHENLHEINITHYTNEKIINAISYINYDIIFSDIELKKTPSYTGICICEQLRKNRFKNEIIFTTAFNEYVFEGYNVQAFNYLLKPISANTLSQCMKHYIKIQENKFYCLKDRSSYIKIKLHSIFYIEKTRT